MVLAAMTSRSGVLTPWQVLQVLVTVGAAWAAPDLESDTCITLDPYDATLPQTSPFPYQLVLNKEGTITNQDSVIVKILSTDSRVEFQEFIVQARDNYTGNAVGMFVDTGDADITLYNCFGCPENTAKEFDSESKREVKMRWMPDFNYEGSVTLYATVIQTKDVYWLRHPSLPLKVYNPW